LRTSKIADKRSNIGRNSLVKLTIHDVAREAGVSVATVDRVLNKRPGVRQQTVERVEETVGRLNYQPDRLAARLARAREYRLAFVLPLGSTAFMEEIKSQVQGAILRGSQDRVSIHIEQADVFSGEALAKTLNGFNDNFDGIAVIALDHPLVREAIDGLENEGVKVVTLVSDLPSSRRSHYVGIDNAAAGRTAGSLLGRFVGNKKGSVGIVMGSLSLRDHVERRYGVEQVLRDEYPHLSILPIQESRDDFKTAEEITSSLIKNTSDLVGLYSIGAGNRGIVSALESSGRGKDVVFIAHDLTPNSRQALTTGTIDAVINQNPGHEVRSAVRVLLSLIDDTDVLEDQERIRIDIFLRDNLP
jgi:LacI family transcriptional regulator